MRNKKPSVHTTMKVEEENNMERTGGWKEIRGKVGIIFVEVTHGCILIVVKHSYI